MPSRFMSSPWYLCFHLSSYEFLPKDLDGPDKVITLSRPPAFCNYFVNYHFDNFQAYLRFIILLRLWSWIELAIHFLARFLFTTKSSNPTAWRCLSLLKYFPLNENCMKEKVRWSIASIAHAFVISVGNERNEILMNLVCDCLLHDKYSNLSSYIEDTSALLLSLGWKRLTKTWK